MPALVLGGALVALLIGSLLLIRPGPDIVRWSSLAGVAWFSRDHRHLHAHRSERLLEVVGEESVLCLGTDHNQHVPASPRRTLELGSELACCRFARGIC